jgi:hypothetical protein
MGQYFQRNLYLALLVRESEGFSHRRREDPPVIEVGRLIRPRKEAGHVRRRAEATPR